MSEDRGAGGDSRRLLSLLQFGLGMGAFLIFFYSPAVYVVDSKYSMLTAESLLRNGTPDLSSYTIPRFDADLPFNTLRGRHAYQLQRTNGRLLYGFPHGGSFLAIPFVALFDSLGISPATPNRELSLAGEVVVQKTLAAALMALFVVMCFRTAMLVLDAKWSAIVAAAVGLGTQVWSVTSRGAWAHTWQITLGIFAVYLLLRSAVRGASIRPIILGTLLAWMYFVRPTGAIQAALVAGYVLIYRRGDFLALVATGLGWLVLLIAYSLRVFGTVVPFYYVEPLWSAAILPVGLYGNLFGPARGLFIYSPILALCFYWALRYWRGLASRPLAVLSLLVFAATLFGVAAHTEWWGGLCFGNRLMTDALPWMVLLGVMGLAAIPPERRNLRCASIAVAAVALILGVAINGVGAFSFNAMDWSTNQSLMLDWSHPQFLAPWRKP